MFRDAAIVHIKNCSKRHPEKLPKNSNKYSWSDKH